MKSSQESSNEKSNDNQASAAPSAEPAKYTLSIAPAWAHWIERERDQAVALVQKLNAENQELYEKLARSQALVTELEATIEHLRDRVEELRCCNLSSPGSSGRIC